jgi:hypothetical protein
MPRVGFEPTTLEFERVKTVQGLDRPGGGVITVHVLKPGA